MKVIVTAIVVAMTAFSIPSQAETPSDLRVQDSRLTQIRVDPDNEYAIDDRVYTNNRDYVETLLKAGYPVPSIILHMVSRGMTVSDTAYYMTLADEDIAEQVYVAIAELLPSLPSWVCDSQQELSYAAHPTCTSTRVVLDAEALFDFDKDKLRPEALPQLEKLIGHLQQNGAGEVRVVGHTDSFGTVEYNQDLSERRAAALVAYLQPRLPGMNIVAQGRGELEPRASNDTPQGRQLNRRVEVFFDIPGRTCGNVPLVKPACTAAPVVLDSETLFDFDKHDLRPEGLSQLDRLAVTLPQYSPTEVRVVGHTDSEGSVEYNQGLSERRAAAVAAYLQPSLKGTRILSAGKSELEPRASNDTPQGRQINRRVEIFYDLPVGSCSDVAGGQSTDGTGSAGAEQRYIRDIADAYFSTGEEFVSTTANSAWSHPDWIKGEHHFLASIDELIELARRDTTAGRQGWWYRNDLGENLPGQGGTPVLVSLYSRSKEIVTDATLDQLLAAKQAGTRLVPVVLVYNGPEYFPAYQLGDAGQGDATNTYRDFTINEVVSRFFRSGDRLTPPREWHLADYHFRAASAEMKKVFQLPSIADIDPATRQRIQSELASDTRSQACKAAPLVLDSETLFDYDKHDLRPEALSQLDNLAGFLAANKPQAARIVGHTDSDGSVEYNQGLSERRAAAVAAYLRPHLTGTRIVSEGKSELEPRASNDTPQGRQLNRRVEVFYDLPAGECAPGMRPALITVFADGDSYWVDDPVRVAVAIDQGYETIPVAFLYHEFRRYGCNIPGTCLPAVRDAIVAAGGQTLPPPTALFPPPFVPQTPIGAPAISPE